VFNDHHHSIHVLGVSHIFVLALNLMLSLKSIQTVKNIKLVHTANDETFKLTNNLNFTMARFLKSLLLEMVQEFLNFFLQMITSTSLSNIFVIPIYVL
jgi:hypothetical protein